MRLTTSALLLALAGLAASSAVDPSQARDRYPKDSYEAHGARTDLAPPVPGFAVWNYQPGMCWKSRHRDRLQGEYIPCSEFFKRKRP
jgi:hypothetical protein